MTENTIVSESSRALARGTIARPRFYSSIAAAVLLCACARTDATPEAQKPHADSEQAQSSLPAKVEQAASVESVEADPLAAMIDIAGVDCKRSEAGVYSCNAPGYDISGDDRACADDDTSFGAVVEGGAMLLDRFPADGANSIAQLPQGQFVCLQFVAEPTSGGEGWAYITAISPAQVKGCNGNATCGSGGLTAKWHSAPPAGECKVGPEGRYTVACPAGWVPRSQLEEFSMGL
jgi:hypothetical protein